MNVRIPDESDPFVKKLLSRIPSEYAPESVPVCLEEYARPLNCYFNVEEKVGRDGGQVHYGWSIYQTDLLCEAERHAVWEDEDGNLIDITPHEVELTHILFVPDNDFVYEGQQVDNIRVNLTTNPLVDDFILVCETVEKIHSYGRRVSDSLVELPEACGDVNVKYESWKEALLGLIKSGGRPHKTCFCGGLKNYKNCHGSLLQAAVNRDMLNLKKDLKG